MISHLAKLLGIVGALLLAVPAQANETLTYDANGNVQSRALPGGTTQYGYDDLDRLSSEAGPAKTQSLTYDTNDNRLSDGSGNKTYTANSNKLATANGQTVTLDQVGNITLLRGLSLDWNQAGQLKTVKQGSTLLATYYYDYRGRRSRKVTPTETTIYIYDFADHLLGEFNASGSPLRTYIWRDDIPVAVILHGSPEKVLYLETDHLNTPIAARDENAKLVWKWESDAFGSTLPNEDPDGDGANTTINLRFPGQFYDKESGFHYNHHRYYDPQAGRYLSPDPIGLAGGRNSFGYANQNPGRFTDSTGLTPGTTAGAAIGSVVAPGPGTIIGAIIGTGVQALIGGAAMAAILSTSGDTPIANGKVCNPAIPDVTPNDLCEQLALAEAKASAGRPIMGEMADAPRLVALYGPGPWIKMQHTHTCSNSRKVVIHYFSNGRGLNVELKFK